MNGQVSILLLEDNSHDAELLRRELERGELSYRLTRVATAEAFRTALATEPVDVILADYSLPDFDGMRALELARRVDPDIPFIFVSGSIGEERALEALRRGATDYILKDRLVRLPTAVMRARAEVEERRMRREAQEALRRSQERFLLAAQATRDVIWDFDVRQDRIWFNDSFRTEWGYDIQPGEMTIGWWSEHVHPEDGPRASDALEEHISGQSTHFQLEYRFRRADGRYGHVLDRGIVIRDAEGKALRVIGAMQDVSGRVEAERQLEQERRISGLGRVAATIAHEFNNVLMGIQPFAEVVKRRSADDPMRMRAAEGILSAVQRGAQITRDILRAANPGEPAPQTFDLAARLEQIVGEIRPMLPGSVSVTADAPSSPLFVRCDPIQLQQVLVNLSVNARDAISGQGAIRFSLSASGQSVVLSVSDSGRGIDPDVLPSIFDPLFTTKPTGTGLGLALARQMVLRNQGTIEVASQPGVGTTFSIRLPAARPEAALDLPSSPVMQGGAVVLRRILIVDDDEAVVEGMRELLTIEGFTVRSVTRAQEVLGAVQSFDPELVILDLTLEDGDGMELFRQLALQRPALPVIIASGRSDRAAIAEAAANPHVAFLRKPFDLDMLLGALRKIA